jgi:hypothetical protein
MATLEKIITYLIVIAFSIVFIGAFFQLNSTGLFMQKETTLTEKTQSNLTNEYQANPKNTEPPETHLVIYTTGEKV